LLDELFEHPERVFSSWSRGAGFGVLLCQNGFPAACQYLNGPQCSVLRREHEVGSAFL
jgi:hypothetical protein